MPARVFLCQYVDWLSENNYSIVPQCGIVLLQLHHVTVPTTSVQSLESIVSVGPPQAPPPAEWADSATFTVQHNNPLNVAMAPVYFVVDAGTASSIQQPPHAPYPGLPAPSVPSKPAPMV